MSFFSGSSRSKFQSAVYSVLLLAFFFAVGLAGGILYRELPSSKAPSAPETKVAAETDTTANAAAATHDQQSAVTTSTVASETPSETPSTPMSAPSVAAPAPRPSPPQIATKAASAPPPEPKAKPVAKAAPKPASQPMQAQPAPAKPPATKEAATKEAETKKVAKAKEAPAAAHPPTEAKPERKVAEAEAAPKAPATRAKAASAPSAAKTVPAAQTPEPPAKKEPTRVAKASPQPASADTPPFRIQFGVFAIEDNAHRTQWTVEATGMPVEITRAPSRKGRLLYFVWSHPFPTRAAAKAAAIAARDKARKFKHPAKIEYVVLNDHMIAAEQGTTAHTKP